MKKKSIAFTLVLMSVLFISGCADLKAKEAYEEITEEIMERNYSEAADYCHIAIKEGYATEEITDINEVLTAYLNAETAYAKRDYVLAKTNLDKISYTDGFPSLMKSIEDLKILVDDALKPQEPITPPTSPEPAIPNPPKPPSTPEKTLTEAECRKIALSGHTYSDVQVSVTDMGSYYRYNITFDPQNDDYSDEYACSVDKKSGRVFDQAG